MVVEKASGGKSLTEEPKLRSACDACRRSKVKCSGGTVCARCYKQDVICHYSLACRAGKPKGSKNKATLKKLERAHSKQQFERWSTNQNERYKDRTDWGSVSPLVPTTLCPNDGKRSLQSKAESEAFLPERFRSVQSLGNLSEQREAVTTVMEAIAHEFAISTTRINEEISHVTSSSFPSPPSDYPISIPSLSSSLSEAHGVPGTATTSWSSFLCNCAESHSITMDLLCNLYDDFALWKFDLSVYALNSALSNYHRVLSCTLCYKDHITLTHTLSVLDSVLRILRMLVLRDIERKKPHTIGRPHVNQLNILSFQKMVPQRLWVFKVLCEVKTVFAMLEDTLPTSPEGPALQGFSQSHSGFQVVPVRILPEITHQFPPVFENSLQRLLANESVDARAVPTADFLARLIIHFEATLTRLRAAHSCQSAVPFYI